MPICSRKTSGHPVSPLSNSTIERSRTRRGAFFPALICILTVLASALRPDGGYAPSPDYGDFGVTQTTGQTTADLKRADFARSIYRPEANRDGGTSSASAPGAGPALPDGAFAILLAPNRAAPVKRVLPTGHAPGSPRGIAQDPRIPTGPPTLV